MSSRANEATETTTATTTLPQNPTAVVPCLTATPILVRVPFVSLLGRARRISKYGSKGGGQGWADTETS